MVMICFFGFWFSMVILCVIVRMTVAVLGPFTAVARMLREVDFAPYFLQM